MKNLLLGFTALLLGPAAYAQVTITQVLDGAAYTNDVAQGSVFVVKGTGMSGPGVVTAPAPTYPKVLNNVQITFTPAAGGTAIQVYMVYLYNVNNVNQLAAVLPSNTATGAYDVRVINGASTSTAFRANVVARKPGIVTVNGDGSGLAQATLGGGLILQRLLDIGRVGNFDTRAARRGDRVDLWGTGLGPDLASDTGGSNGDQTTAATIRVIVDGTEVTPAYAGRSQGFPGLDQIVFNIPSNATLGCFITVQVRAGGVLSNRTTISVADGSGCTDASLTADMARKLSQGGTVTTGNFSVVSTATDIPGITIGPVTLPPSTVYGEFISGSFSTFTGSQYYDAGFSFTSGVCSVFRRTGSISSVALGVTPSDLDAGTTLTAIKPDNSTVSLTKSAGNANLYSSTVASGSTRTLPAGTYRLSGSGGTDVGAFNAQVQVPSVTWSNKTSITSINRSTPLTINWTGSGSGNVGITGYSGRAIAGTGASATFDATGFLCIAPVSAGTFTVPTSILQQLQAAAFDPTALAGGSNFSIGVLGVVANTDAQSGRFTAPLVKGGSIDAGIFGYVFGDTKLLSVQ